MQRNQRQKYPTGKRRQGSLVNLSVSCILSRLFSLEINALHLAYENAGRELLSLGPRRLEEADFMSPESYDASLYRAAFFILASIFRFHTDLAKNGIQNGLKGCIRYITMPDNRTGLVYPSPTSNMGFLTTRAGEKACHGLQL